MHIVDSFFVYFLGGLEFLIYVWIRTQRAAVASRRATNSGPYLSSYSSISLFIDKDTYVPCVVCIPQQIYLFLYYRNYVL